MEVQWPIHRNGECSAVLSHARSTPFPVLKVSLHPSRAESLPFLRRVATEGERKLDTDLTAPDHARRVAEFVSPPVKMGLAIRVLFPLL